MLFLPDYFQLRLIFMPHIFYSRGRGNTNAYTTTIYTWWMVAQSEDHARCVVLTLAFEKLLININSKYQPPSRKCWKMKEP